MKDFLVCLSLCLTSRSGCPTGSAYRLLWSWRLLSSSPPIISSFLGLSPPSLYTTANVDLGDTGHLSFAKHCPGFGDTRMRRRYGGCFDMVTELGISLTDMQKPSHVGIWEGQILPPLLPPSPLPPPLSPLLLASVSCASPFKDIFTDRSHCVSLDVLELIEIISASAFQVLQLKECATMPGFYKT